MRFNKARASAFLICIVGLGAAQGASAQDRPRTALRLDSLSADSVLCGGLTFQLTRVVHDGGRTGSNREAIELYIRNRSDSARTYEAHLFAAIDSHGSQVNFLSAEEIAAVVGGRLFSEPRNREGILSRREFIAERVLPGASTGRKLLVPQPDVWRDLKGPGVTLFCGETRLGLLHRQ